MKRTSALSAIAIAAVLGAASPRAEQSPDISVSSEALVDQAQERMAMTFQNLTIVDFRESPVQGLYQADIGGQIVYYSPEPELLLFGQIFDRDGVNLTSRAQQATLVKKIDALDLDLALTMGPATGVEIVEFSNPNCGYCRALDRFLRTIEEEGRPIRRKIVFATFDDASARKAQHILCSDDPEHAYQMIYGGTEPAAFATCPEGREMLTAHVQMSRTMGVTGTPTLLLGGRPVQGFRQGEIMAFLDSKGVSPHED